MIDVWDERRSVTEGCRQDRPYDRYVSTENNKKVLEHGAGSWGSGGDQEWGGWGQL